MITEPLIGLHASSLKGQQCIREMVAAAADPASPLVLPQASLRAAEEHRQQVLGPQQKGKGPKGGTPEQGHYSAGADQQADPAGAEQRGQARQHERRQEIDAAVARVHRQEPKLAGETRGWP